MAKAFIHTINTSTDKSMKFTLKQNAINIFEEPENNLWTFDLEGRLVGMFVNGNNYRRTLNNKYFLKSRIDENRQVFRTVTEISKPTVLPLLNTCLSLIQKHINDLPNQSQSYLKKILNKNFTELEKDAEIFSKIYLPISILPPDQYMSIVIQLTEGCNYNQCTFCNFYKDRPFKVKSLDELEDHIQAVKEYFGDGLKLRKSIFLADANAISTPTDRLISAHKLINSHFPNINEIYSFVDVFTGMKKSIADLKELKILGLKRVYLGVESGNYELMPFLKKDQSNADIVELINIIKAAELNVGIIFLIGAGGQEFSENHLKDSLNLVEQLPLSTGDIIYLSELNDTNQQYEAIMKDMNYSLPTKFQIREWSNSFKKEAKKIVGKQVQVSIYDINQFFY